VFAATVAGRLGAGSGCVSTERYIGRPPLPIEPVVSCGGGAWRFEA
jgi:hypothetical protein